LFLDTHNELLIQCLEDALQLNTDPLVATKLEKCHSMISGLENYLEQICPEETELQKEILADTISEPWKENLEKGITVRPFSPEMMSTRHSSKITTKNSQS